MQDLRTSVSAMIDRYVEEIGLSKKETFNTEKNAWYWQKGSARIEVFIHEMQLENNSRFYLRIFSPIIRAPKNNQLEFYKKLLEINDAKLGVKLTLMPGSEQVYATFERDIKGIDYEELSTCIADLEWWADELDDALASEFAGSLPS